MSQEHVKAFYERLAQDEIFKAQIEKAKTKQECSQIVREAGYIFTQEEFEAFTAQLLDSSAELNSEQLGEAELEAAVGGFLLEKVIDLVQAYGLPPGL
ncbi:Nitrogen fixation protein [Hyella patelloides LEGE 07179]|uniref:Nitrogen fixation protein n=1 Tax=Hyella patelloides LEGE 07179 TaxID=945734 RepID=A0A563W4D5_9CYAN|nr:Nif11-like leader peptide family natural product precursor [Hyella patelloides]VEP18559.1 Nitrogen fixation protein [Hyella patelloides LEGE 07179]